MTDTAETPASTITQIDTGSDDLLAHIDGPVGVITLNRPERRNALSDGIYGGIAAALPIMRDDPQVRVVMITGSGVAFCAGGDVKGMHERNTSGGNRTGRAGASQEDIIANLRQRQREVSLTIHEFPKPVVAALPGAAAGAGLSIALAADLRLAAERAVIVTAFANVGASGDFGGSWFLTQLIGPARAKELYFTSPRLTAAEAKDLGIVNVILPDDDFAAAALAYCRDLAGRAPIAQRYMKENINRATSVSLATALDAEAAAMVRTMNTDDHREAAAAFVEKRSPEFKGS